MSKVKFVEATSKDKSTCLEMIKDFYTLDDYPFDHERASRNFEEIITNEHLGRFWVLVVGNLTAGYLILTFGYSLEYGGRDAFIDELYLKSEFRGKGLGTQALATLDKLAAQLGVNAIHLEVEKSNSAGNRLYTKSGFSGNDRSLLTKVIEK